MRHAKGFSIVELVIVMAIILVIAAIATPILMRSRMQANEASSVAAIRAINTAQIAYSVYYPQVGFADHLGKLGPGAVVDASHAHLLDSSLGCASQPCIKSGYQFAIVSAEGTPVVSYELTASPMIVNVTGRRGFCSSQLANLSEDATGGSNCSLVAQKQNRTREGIGGVPDGQPTK